MKKAGKLLAVAIALATLSAGAIAGCNGGNEPTGGGTSIELDQETLSLDADNSAKLAATGADEIDWASENPAVATVDQNGNVTGVNPGTCKITAATKDGKFEAECTVTVSGYHKSTNVFAGFTKIENNTYNGEINYAIGNTSEDAFVVTYDRAAMTNSWASLVLWYDCSLSPTSFDLEFEVTQGAIPCLQFEFGGESSFKQFERHRITDGKNTVSVNTTDLDLDGEGSWKAIYLELNNPCPLDGTTDDVKENTEITFTKISMTEGAKKAPDAPANAEVKKGIVYWDRVLAASEYELEVDGVAYTDLMTRTIPDGDAPVMRRAYKPAKDNAFTAGNHTAKIRSKNSAGVSEWKEFSFVIEAEGEDPVADTFKGIASHQSNQWNNPADFYTATEQDDGSLKIAFTATASGEWNTYCFKLDELEIDGVTTLHIKCKLVSGTLEKIRYGVDRWNNETSSSENVYGADIAFDADGYAEITVEVAGENLNNSNKEIMLYLSKYATADSAYEIEVIDVSIY